jgi:hypothetical protein
VRGVGGAADVVPNVGGAIVRSRRSRRRSPSHRLLTSHHLTLSCTPCRERRRVYPSAIAWEGPSVFDGAPIAVIVSNIGNVYSKNPKCGKYMAQATILLADLHPQDAILTGRDYSVCGGCKHRGVAATNSRGALVSTRSCYVVIKGLLSVYHAVKKGSYPRIEPRAISEQIRRRAVLRGVPAALRIGSYGDPAAVPTWVWKDLASEVKIVTGYTHQWKQCDQEDVPDPDARPEAFSGGGHVPER